MNWNGWLPLLLYMPLQWHVQISYPGRYANGLLSRPLRKRIRTAQGCRFTQVLALSVTAIPFVDGAGNLIFWGGALLLLLDDYLFGDDDRRRRLWQAIRNRVKWKMALPAPTGGGTRTPW